jgi:hypothetical protein
MASDFSVAWQCLSKRTIVFFVTDQTPRAAATISTEQTLFCPCCRLSNRLEIETCFVGNKNEKTRMPSLQTRGAAKLVRNSIKKVRNFIYKKLVDCAMGPVPDILVGSG